MFVGVSMLVPEGAVPKGCTEDIFIAVLREDKDRPKLAGKTVDLTYLLVCIVQLFLSYVSLVWN